MVTRRIRRSHGRLPGFTLIELMVVLAIVAMLAAIVSPHYFKSIDRAKAVSLRTSLKVMRDAIDKFAGDQDRYPESLEELVQRQYVRELPVDPVTGRSDTWVASPPPADAVSSDGVADVHSGATGMGEDGIPYAAY